MTFAILVVTDRHGHPRPLPDTVAACLDGGADGIWFRDRDLDPAARARLGEAVARAVARGGGRLVVGADAGLAARLGADGLHMPGGSAPDTIAAARAALPEGCRVGVSAHDPAEVGAARRAGADYATLSPVFASASKPGYGPALGTAGLVRAAAHGLPVLALGGIAPAVAGACRAAGAAGLAVMGTAMRAPDPAAAVRALRAAWDEAEGGSGGGPSASVRPENAAPHRLRAQRADG